MVWAYFGAYFNLQSDLVLYIEFIKKLETVYTRKCYIPSGLLKNYSKSETPQIPV